MNLPTNEETLEEEVIIVSLVHGFSVIQHGIAYIDCIKFSELHRLT